MKRYLLTLCLFVLTLLTGCQNIPLDLEPPLNPAPVSVEEVAPVLQETEFLGESDLPYQDTLQAHWEPLDAYGRAQGVWAVVSPATTRKSAGRPDIVVDPPGFLNQKTESGWLYNRSHLLAYTLWSDDRTEKAENIITGTEYMNQVLMAELEDAIRAALADGTPVTVRMVPEYQGGDLVARSVLMDIVTPTTRQSYRIPNVEPGWTIDYATGQAWEE